MLSEDAGSSLMGPKREYCPSPPRRYVRKQANNEQALLRAIHRMPEPVAINMPARCRKVVGLVGTKRKMHRPKPPPSLAIPTALTDELFNRCGQPIREASQYCRIG